jgi:hypothetical protein
VYLVGVFSRCICQVNARTGRRVEAHRLPLAGALKPKKAAPEALPFGVFAVLVVPCDHGGRMGLGEEASPDKWGRLHNEMTSQFVVRS